NQCFLLYQWRIDINGKSLYIITLDNSYRLNIVQPELDGRVHTNDFKYLYCYYEFKKDFPDTVIRPNSLADKLSNSFFHFSIKIKNRPKFNDKYIIESRDKYSILGLLNENVISLFEDSSEIIIEIRDKKCLIMSLRSINYEDSNKMIKIVEELMY
ncbi:MAG: hypothetical protein KKB74_05725, partial [Bacteroidetes bacterium]|nr:hypothetical protein [Bacteroidota bacterium]